MKQAKQKVIAYIKSGKLSKENGLKALKILHQSQKNGGSFSIDQILIHKKLFNTSHTPITKQESSPNSERTDIKPIQSSKKKSKVPVIITIIISTVLLLSIAAYLIISSLITSAVEEFQMLDEDLLSLENHNFDIPSSEFEPIEKVDFGSTLKWLKSLDTRFDNLKKEDLHSITKLNLGLLKKSQITVGSLEYLTCLKALTHLDLQCCTIDGKALTHLSTLKSLKSLNLNASIATNDIFKQLEEFESLTLLSLLGAVHTDGLGNAFPYSEKDIQNLKKKIPNCTIVSTHQDIMKLKKSDYNDLMRIPKSLPPNTAQQ